MVYILSQYGQPIMPTQNHAKVRVLLKSSAEHGYAIEHGIPIVYEK